MTLSALAVLLLPAISFAQPPQSAESAGCLLASFSDDTFDDADWSTSTINISGNGGSASASQSTSGGNPDDYWSVTHTVGAAEALCNFFHEKAGAVHDPSSQGSIGAISVSYDIATFYDDGFGGQTSTVAIRQGGTYYRHTPGFVNGSMTWTTSSGQFTESDFTDIVTGTTSPDFSASGGPIQFGLWTSNYNPPGGFPFTATTIVGYDNWSVLILSADPETYCTAGTSASGCQALISSSGTASASATSGFSLLTTGVEGSKDGLFFFGTNGRQANPWGSGTSFQCVVPPVVRAGLLTGTGTSGQCDGAFAQDMNALWCPSCPKPAKNPGAGAVVQAQLWYRDPANTSNQTTSLSDAIEFVVCP